LKKEKDRKVDRDMEKEKDRVRVESEKIAKEKKQQGLLELVCI
jgi:hypothetical protein